MKKILFLVQSYPAQNSANALCDETIINALSKTNQYEIHVMCGRYYGQEKEEIIHGIIVHRVNRGLLWKAYSWAIENEQNARAKYILSANRIIWRLKQLLTIPLYPMVQPILCAKYCIKADQLYSKYLFDLVWADHFSLEYLLAGMHLKKKNHQIKFVPMFWDALSAGLDVNYLPKMYSRRRRKNLERKILQVADCPIFLKAHKERMEKEWGTKQEFTHIHFLDIPRFVVPDMRMNGMPSMIKEFDTKDVNIVFAGNLGQRKVDYVFEILSNIENPNIKLWFFTPMEFEEELTGLAKLYGLTVYVMGYVAHSVLEQYLISADIFLNIGVDSDCIIPSKIFEYMSYGKMILSVQVNEHDPCIKYFKKYKGAILINDGSIRGDLTKDICRVKQMIESAKSFNVNRVDLINAFYDNTPDAYIEILEKLAEDMH